MSKNNQGLAVQHGVAEYYFHASAADFDKIPGSPLAYWLSTPLSAIYPADADSIVPSPTKCDLQAICDSATMTDKRTVPVHRHTQISGWRR